MSSLELIDPHDLGHKDHGLSFGLPLKTLIVIGITFLAALATRLGFAFLDGHETIVYSCDASEYLRAAKTLSSTLENAAKTWPDSFLYCLGLLPQEKASAIYPIFEPLKEVVNRAGPTFPLFLLTSYTITGNPISSEYYYAPVVFHCLITSLTCMLIAYVTCKCWSRTAGLGAGLLAAFYPGFIVNSIRLYSESYAAFWLMAALAILTHIHLNQKWLLSIGLGYCLGILQTTRSALVLVTGATVVFLTGLSGWKAWKKSLSLTIVGLALALLPCLILQNLAVGKTSLVQDRLGHYNLFVGLDVNSQGWLSYPYPDGRGIEEHSFLSLMKRRFDESHSRFIKLLMDKPLRLFKFPWNDFRTPIFIFAENIQVILHQGCLMLAALGVSTALFKSEAQQNKKENQRIIYLRMFILLLLALHSAYFFFITVPRYALTAMPLILIFSGAGIYSLGEALLNKKKQLAGLTFLFFAATLALVTRVNFIPALIELLGTLSNGAIFVLILDSLIKLTFAGLFFLGIYLVGSTNPINRRATILCALAIIPFIALPLRAHGRQFEWQKQISEATGPLRQTIYLPLDKREDFLNRDSYLLVDCKSWHDAGQSIQIKLNDKAVSSELIPIMPFAQDLNHLETRKLGTENNLYYECEDIYKSVLEAAGGTNLDPRQWFILPLSPDIISSSFASAKPQLQVEIASKPGRVAHLYGAYQTENSAVWIPSVARYSWEKLLYGVENENDFTDSRFDEKYQIQTLPKQGKSQSNIRLLLAPGEKLSTVGPITNIEETTSKSFIGTTQSIGLAEFPEYDEDTIWSVTYNGAIESDIDQTITVPVQVDASMVSESATGTARYTSPWVPSSIQLNKGTNKFSFSFPIKPSAFKHPKSLEIKISRGGVADSTQYFGAFYKPENKNCGLSQNELDRLLKTKVKWQKASLTVSSMPHYPTALGYEIF